MKLIKNYLFIVLLLINTILMSGCWNYREVDRLSIVSGAAIDKGENKKYLITVETIELKAGGEDTQTNSKIVGAEGETIFDAVRDIITLTGKRLYWGHAKVVVASEEIAREGIVPIADWFVRDAETRAEIKVLISKTRTAREILDKHALTQEVVSLELADMLKNQRSISKAPDYDIWELINVLSGYGNAVILPTIDLEINGTALTQHIHGSAVFKKDRLIDFSESEETKYILFVLNKIEGGILPQRIYMDNEYTDISLEILNNKTKVTPEYADGKIKIKVNVKTEVTIAELGSTVNFMEKKGKATLVKEAEKTLKKDIEDVIKRAQKEYECDIFGFGNKIHKNMPTLWKSIEGNWEDIFKQLDVEVYTEINATSSALMSKPLKVGG